MGNARLALVISLYSSGIDISQSHTNAYVALVSAACDVEGQDQYPKRGDVEVPACLELNGKVWR
jgi:hypothetical protein